MKEGQTVAEIQEQQKETERLEALRDELNGVKLLMYEMMTDDPDTRGGCAKTMAVKYWKDRCEELGIITVRQFFDRYLNTKDIFTESSLSAASRAVKLKFPHLRPAKEVEERNERTAQVYKEEYYQK